MRPARQTSRWKVSWTLQYRSRVPAVETNSAACPPPSGVGRAGAGSGAERPRRSDATVAHATCRTWRCVRSARRGWSRSRRDRARSLRRPASRSPLAVRSGSGRWRPGAMCATSLPPSSRRPHRPPSRDRAWRGRAGTAADSWGAPRSWGRSHAGRQRSGERRKVGTTTSSWEYPRAASPRRVRSRCSGVPRPDSRGSSGTEQAASRAA